MSILQTEAIKNFLTKMTHPDLAALYNEEMEVQLNAAQDGGERVDGEFKGRRFQVWTDGMTQWKSLRIPYQANTEPVYEPKKMSWDLAQHTEGIGLTGWNWVQKKSLWVGFDFDAIMGHSEKHQKKLTEAQLREVQKAVTDLDWVTVRKSTGGRGLHLYVFLDGVPTQNHTEHAALGRAILGKMSAMSGFDFQSKVDAAGGNLWFYHRKMRGTDGLTLIKQGGKLMDIPMNWEDHISVVSGKRRKMLPQFVRDAQDGDIEAAFEEVTSKRSHVPLDANHEKLIRYLEDNNCLWAWDQDSKMLTAYTWDLKQAHEKLGMKGVFQTNATGRDHGAGWNCFCFPMWNGGWCVRRFSKGVEESSTWEQDGQGFTKCYLNVDPDLKIASRLHEGVEDDKGGFNFMDAQSATQAAKALGANIDLPAKMMGRQTRLSIHKDGRLKVEVDKEDRDDGGDMRGWLPTKNKKHWMRILDAKIGTPVESETANYDDMIRHTTTESDGKDYQTGWTLKGDGLWRMKKKDDVKTYLKGVYDQSGKEVDQILGSCISKPWTIVCRPFQPEFLGDRLWNRNAAQLRYAPSENRDNLSYPNWMKILDHIGQGLNVPVGKDPWCKSNGILKGSDYLKCWIASLFQEPEQPLPYLFLYSEAQSTGKSIFHEALNLLMTCGVVRADTALLNSSGFNAELEGCVLGVIEETDLRTNRSAQERIKDWVTSPSLQIHSKGSTPYHITNTLHFVQCANDYNFCPIIHGDTRIVMIEIHPLDPLDMIPKKELFLLLMKEAPDFLAEILNLEIPPSNDRLNIPIINTEEKIVVQMMNESFLEKFIKEECFEYSGETIKWSEFYDRFINWLDPMYRDQWGKVKTGRKMPMTFPKGRLYEDGGQFYVGNLTFVPPAPDAKIKEPLHLVGDRLVPKEVSK